MPDLAARRPPVLEARELTVTAGSRTILRGVNLCVRAGEVQGLIGPSGAGKSTLLRCLNRLVDLTPDMRVSGDVLFQGRTIWGATAARGDDLRTTIGILFQQPVVFPQSILKNVLFGASRLGLFPRNALADVAEQALRSAALWDEVKDRLREPAARLSAGQQQRLCLARTLASQPEVLLMDEPTSALDPRSTQSIESLILDLKSRHTIVLVTHHVGQARRVADRTALLAIVDGAGTVVEDGPTPTVLERPRTEAVRQFLRVQP